MRETPRLVVRNDTDRPLALALEPWGEEHALPPGGERAVLYAGCSDGGYFSVVLGPSRLAVWAEGSREGTLEVLEDAPDPE